MHMYDLILKKRKGGILTAKEIHYMIQGYTNSEIPDYQMSAMTMAICFNGMTEEETLHLTMEMAQSGDMLDLSPIHGKKCDKHSTGGVGDKTSLILGPMVAAAGIPVAKMSGRGLGHTGGTIDKLESIPGFSTALLPDTFMKNVNEIKLAIAGQTANLAPADKKLYALRDVTATVDQMSLIASSIMSKKLAAGADAIVLDVKTGSGAFMKTTKDSFALAQAMVKLGNGAGRKTTAIISDMNQPLGHAVGNALEVMEAIKTLKGKGPKDLTKLCIVLGSHMLKNVDAAATLEEGEHIMSQVLYDGSALEKFAQFIRAQGGNAQVIDNPLLLPSASIIEKVISSHEGYVAQIKTDEIGMTSLILGGGRTTKEDSIDLSVGVVLSAKYGDYVKKGDVLAVLHGNSEEKMKTAKERLLNAYTFSIEKPALTPLIHGIVTE